MPHPLSNDLRKRVVAYVEAGHSCMKQPRTSSHRYLSPST